MVDFNSSVSSVSGAGSAPKLTSLASTSKGAQQGSKKAPVDKNLTKDGSIFNMVSGRRNANKPGFSANGLPQNNVLNKNLDKTLAAFAGPNPNPIVNPNEPPSENPNEVPGVNPNGNPNGNQNPNPRANQNITGPRVIDDPILDPSIQNPEQPNAPAANQQENPDEEQEVNAITANYGNLSQYSIEELNKIKGELETLINGAPRAQKADYESKLTLVNNEIQSRANDQNEGNGENNNSGGDDHGTGADQAVSGSDEAKDGTAKTNDIGKKELETEKNIQKLNAQLKKQNQIAQTAVKKNAQAATKESKNINKLEKENEALNNRIVLANEQIQATTEPAASDDSDPNNQNNQNAQIETIKAQVATSQARITLNARNMRQSANKLRRFQTEDRKTIRTLTKETKATTAAITSAQKQTQEDTQKNNGFLGVMNKIDNIAGKVVTVSTVVEMTGHVLQHCIFTEAIGAAMVVAGTYGKVVGNYAKAAANVGKAACYAVEGNILGCLTSVATAAMSASTAIKGTQQLNQMAGKGATAASEGAQKAGAEAGKKAGEEASSEAGGKAAEKAIDKAKDSAISKYVADAGEDTINKAAKKSLSNGLGNYFKDQVRGAALEKTSLQDSLLNLGTSFQTAASAFESPQDTQPKVVTTQTNRRRIQNMGFRRRRVA